MFDTDTKKILAKNIEVLPIKGEILLKISHEMMQIIKYFFSSNGKEIIPFRGFLLEGPPGIGKTELVKQTARIIGAELFDQDIKVNFLFKQIVFVQSRFSWYRLTKKSLLLRLVFLKLSTIVNNMPEVDRVKEVVRGYFMDMGLYDTSIDEGKLLYGHMSDAVFADGGVQYSML